MQQTSSAKNRSRTADRRSRESNIQAAKVHRVKASCIGARGQGWLAGILVDREPGKFGGAEGIRTLDLLDAIEKEGLFPVLPISAKSFFLLLLALYSFYPVLV
jgi:hypothetical protein